MTGTNESEPRPDEQDQYRPTLGDLSHSNPRTGERFGEAMVYRRGPAVAADGGAAGAGPEESEAEATADADDGRDQDQDLCDVDHTPPGDAEGANRVHERGGEGRTENV